ncbi:uncharacterized protein LOC116220852 isoform X2 [Clupea harengus]|uniref:Uncharacterized protein LOC116220852 isoform X2 n=1 Tax=Clupea harengus TaxID=7950 RepID=A0A6P8FQ33_CLUHA|nr:uncharacterized protein LOC116220852 isoform X2 [Clupea harengus]
MKGLKETSIIFPWTAVSVTTKERSLQRLFRNRNTSTKNLSLPVSKVFHEEMIVDDFHVSHHVTSGKSSTIKTLLIIILQCRFVAATDPNCPYIPIIKEWGVPACYTELHKAYPGWLVGKTQANSIPRDFRLEIPLGCGDKISCDDLLRALVNSYCMNRNCSDDKPNTSCNETNKKTKTLIYCLNDNYSISCQEPLGFQNPRIYMLVNDTDFTHNIQGCLMDKVPGTTASTTCTMTTTTTTSRSAPTTVTPGSTPTSSTPTTSSIITDSTQSPTPSHASHTSEQFSATSGYGMLVILLTSLGLNITLSWLLLKQRSRHQQQPINLSLDYVGAPGEAEAESLAGDSLP